MEIVDDYTDIIVDIAICDYAERPGGKVHKNAAMNWIEAMMIKSFYTGGNALEGAARAYPGLEVRNYF